MKLGVPIPKKGAAGEYDDTYGGKRNGTVRGGGGKELRKQTDGFNVAGSNFN